MHFCCLPVLLPSYIHITEDVSSYLDVLLKEGAFTQIFVLVDENTVTACLPIISSVLPEHAIIIEIASGEKHKNLTTCGRIWSQLTAANADRRALLINLGGGVITDMGGFSAATYKRGISFVNIPTTLLAQVDASIGGKLGIDFEGFKNHIGLFQIPDKVIVDPTFLEDTFFPRTAFRICRSNQTQSNCGQNKVSGAKNARSGAYRLVDLDHTFFAG